MSAPRRVSAMLVSLMIVAASLAIALPPGLAAAVATWPPSTGLVVAEVMTGGASASDEYVELANAGSAAADLGGMELIYVTASGATTTRKAAFDASLSLAPGRHLVVANAAGAYSSLADATYSGGLAADGGALALRRVDGAVIDAVGWGTAANAYVEGSPAPAPPAKSSIERLPGGSAGNRQDTNDNLSDWLVQPSPIPQPLGSTPPPGPSSTPTLDATPSASPSSTVTEPGPTSPATGTPPSPTGTPSIEPTSIASAPSSSTPGPTGSSAPTPPVSATASPTPVSPAPSAASPKTDLETIAAARAQPTGSRAHVAGVVALGLGLVGIDGLIAIQDSTAGIFVRLPAPYVELPVGCSVELEGTLAAPYGQLEIRELDWLAAGAEYQEPAAMWAGLEDIGEGTEGSLVTIRGTADSIQSDGGRLTITIGDGVNEVRALADPPTGISRSDVARGDIVVATGVVGQHATATGRLDGYRLWLRRQTDIEIRSQIPTDPPDPTVRPAATRTSGSAAAMLSGAGMSPDSAPGPVPIASLWQYVDRQVTVAGLITGASGGTTTIDDGTGAIRVAGEAAAEALSMLKPGDAIEVTGVVRQDAQGLIVEADPDSIIDLPGDGGYNLTAASGRAGLPGGGLTLTQAPHTSPAAAASVRIVTSPYAQSDVGTLLVVLLALLASLAGAVLLARRPRRLPFRPHLRLHSLNPARWRPRPLATRRRGR